MQLEVSLSVILFKLKYFTETMDFLQNFLEVNVLS